MKKIKSLQEKLGAELVSLSQKMADLQTTSRAGGQVCWLLLNNAIPPVFPSACRGAIAATGMVIALSVLSVLELAAVMPS